MSIQAQFGLTGRYCPICSKNDILRQAVVSSHIRQGRHGVPLGVANFSMDMFLHFTANRADIVHTVLMIAIAEICVVDRGGKKGIVVTANGNGVPLGFRAAVIDVRQSGAAVKEIVGDICHAYGNINAGYTAAETKRAVFNAGHALGNGDAC